MLIDLRSQFGTDACHFAEFVYSGGSDLLNRAEMPNEFLLALRPHSSDRIQDGTPGGLTSQIAVISEGKAMSRIPDPAQEEQSRLVIGPNHRLLLPLQVDFF